MRRSELLRTKMDSRAGKESNVFVESRFSRAIVKHVVDCFYGIEPTFVRNPKPMADLLDFVQTSRGRRHLDRHRRRVCTTLVCGNARAKHPLRQAASRSLNPFPAQD